MSNKRIIHLQILKNMYISKMSISNFAYYSYYHYCKNRSQHIVFHKSSYPHKTRLLPMIWPSKKSLVGPRMSYDVINPRMIELEVAKKILAELFDIRTHEVDEMIQARIEERTLYGREFNL